MGASLPNAADPVNSMSSRTRRPSARPCGRDGLWRHGGRAGGQSSRPDGPLPPVMMDRERDGPVSRRLFDKWALAHQGGKTRDHLAAIRRNTDCTAVTPLPPPSHPSIGIHEISNAWRGKLGNRGDRGPMMLDKRLTNRPGRCSCDVGLVGTRVITVCVQ